MGKFIELLHETNLPDGLPVTVDIHPKSFSSEEKRKRVDELCGSWADDDSLPLIFIEIECNRRNSILRDLYS